jgi:hypothetical protein
MDDTLTIEDRYFEAIAIGASKIRFAGIDRGADELPRDAFVAQLVGRAVMRGEWRPRWAENGNDFDVEIVSFGYPPNSCLGQKLGKQSFDREERGLLEELVHALFSNTTAKQKLSDFRPERKGVFLGRIYFLPGWIEHAKPSLHMVRPKN